MSSSQPRNVKIGDNERGGWSSDRPRRPGEPERPPRKQDVSVRGRVLGPTDRMRYSPGSLLLIACADRTLRDRFTARVIDEQSAVLSLDKVRTLLQGRVPAEELDAKAQALLDAAAMKRLTAGQTVVIPLETLGPEERERYVRIAATSPARAAPGAGRGRQGPRGRGRPRAARRAAPRRSTAASMGAEGFMTSMRLGGRMVEELKKIIFAPPPADD